jgi:nicotinamidase-related amidase
MVTALDKNTALVLIDLQNGIVNLPMAHPVQNILATSAMLVAAFRKANLPIVIVNVNPSGNWLQSRKDAKAPAFTPPAEWLEIAPEILTQPTDVFITKRTWSAFFDTALDEQLKAKGVTDIVLAGISTSIGVEGTARDASRLGYNIAFATDAMTDMVASAHEHSQKIIFPRLGEVDTTDKIIELL